MSDTKLCKDCKHHDRVGASMLGDEIAACTHGRSYDGDICALFSRDMRADETLCGLNAKLWEPIR